MSFASLLIQACTVERWTDGGQDAYGQPVKTWADHIVDEPCRISYPKGRQVQRGTEVVPVEAVLFVDDIDVTEHDRVTVDGTLYGILFVATYRDSANVQHKELSLERVIA